MTIPQQYAAPVLAGVAVIVAWLFVIGIDLMRGEQGTIFPRQRGR